MRQAKITIKRRKAITGLLFISPWIIGVIWFFLIPLIKTVIYSFGEVEFDINGYYYSFSGIDKYHFMLFEDVKYLPMLWKSIQNLLLNVPVILVFSFFVALLLKQKFVGNAVAISIFFLPVIITSGALVYVIDTNATSGMFEAASDSASIMMNNADIGVLLQQMTNNSELVNGIVGIMDQVFVILWGSGVQILIFLAGLQSIPTSLYESACVDGATGWESFWKITVPMIMPLMVVNVVYTIIDSFSNYNSELLRYINSTIFGKADYAFGTALSWIYFVAMFAMILLIVFILRKISNHYSM